MKEQELITFLQQEDFFEIISHANPDGDTLGSGMALCLGLRQLGKKANLVCADPIPSLFSALFTSYEPMDFIPKKIIAVDTADRRLMGKFSFRHEKIDVSIDHHASCKPFAEQTYLLETLSSTCEIVHGLLTKLKVELTQPIANAIFTGLATDTGFFKYDNVTWKTMEIAAKLLKAGAEHSKIAKTHFGTSRFCYLKFQEEVFKQGEFLFEGKGICLIIPTALVEKYEVTPNEIDRISSVMMELEGVEVGIVCKEKQENQYKISLRSEGTLCVNKICETFGGGGHARAAGCFIPLPISQVKEKLIDAIVEEWEKVRP